MITVVQVRHQKIGYHHSSVFMNPLAILNYWYPNPKGGGHNYPLPFKKTYRPLHIQVRELLTFS